MNILENAEEFLCKVSSALCWLTGEFSRRTGIEASIEMENIEGVFVPVSQILIYRVFQESLTNIAKHAHATRMGLFVRRAGDRVEFCVEDDGRGCDLERVSVGRAPFTGLWLAAMVERVRMLGGTHDMSSRKHEGIRIVFSVPVSQQWKLSEVGDS